MVNPASRMRVLHGRLALVRNGYGAATMSKEVKKLSLVYAHKINDGHMGPRKFWRNYLPRLKFHNPEVEMEVTRKEIKGGPATLTVHFEGGKEEIIDCQHKHENDICKKLFAVTKAQEIPINPEDSLLAEEYLKAREAAKESEVQKLVRRAARKEQERLLGA